MSFLGMDVEAALRHARSLEVDGANEILGVITRMTGLIPSLMEAWHGPDAEAFRQQWEEHATNLRLLHGALTGIANSLNDSIRAQQAASQG